MANIAIIVTRANGTVAHSATHASRYSVSSLIRKVRTAVAANEGVKADTMTAEGYEIGNAANCARVAGATWIEVAPAAA